MLKNKICIAKIGKTVGLKGELKLHIQSDFPEQFCKNAIFTTSKNIKLTIESFIFQSKVIKFKEFNSINEACKLINQEIFTTKKLTKDICKLDKNQYFWFDLVGCKVIENDIELGKIKEIQRYPQCDYFEISTSSDLIIKKKMPKVFLLPYTSNYIKNVNLNDKIINVQNGFDILETS
jgi:16S rRNA processing protein RimM